MSGYKICGSLLWMEAVLPFTLWCLKKREDAACRERDEGTDANITGSDGEMLEERRGKVRRLIKREKARWRRGQEMGEMPQAAERRHNCHMQSLRGCVCVHVCVYKPLHFSALLLSQWTGEPPSVCSTSVYKSSSRFAAGIRSKLEDNAARGANTSSRATPQVDMATTTVWGFMQDKGSAPSCMSLR